MENSRMKVILLSESDDIGALMANIFKRTIRRSCVFELVVVGDARQLLEETDFTDLSTAILVDMCHAHARDVVRQLNAQNITKRLSVVVICTWENRHADVQFGRDHGARSYFIIGRSNPLDLPALIYDMRGVQFW